MKNIIGPGLILAVVFQFIVLSGMYIGAALPLVTGSEIKVKTVPVDPRSMFRGNYAMLRYELSQIGRHYFPGGEDLRQGEVVYTALKPGSGDLYELSGVSLEKPDGGVFLRGRIAYRSPRGGLVRVKYGIEAFFAPKEKALELERKLRKGGVAVLMVSGSGKARIREVVGRVQ